MSGLSIVLPNAAFAAGNVIASLYPKFANFQALDVYNVAGAKRLLGKNTTPITTLGSPSFQANSVIGAAPATGFDTGVPDHNVKTILLLAKFPAANALGAGLFNNTGSVDLGDTLAFMGTGDLRTLMSQSNTGNLQSLLPGVRQLLTTGTYYLFAGEWTASGTRVRYVKNGVVTSSAESTTAARSVAAARNVRILASHEGGTASGYNNNMEVASSAIWTGATLTEAEILSMYNVYKSLLGTSITIG